MFKGNVCTGVAIANKPGAAAVIKIAMEKDLIPTKRELTQKRAKYSDIVARVKASDRFLSATRKG
jgi:hypothetical protein